MGIFDKINKNDILEKAKNTATKVADSAKTSFENVQEAYQKNKEQRELAKMPQEGGIKRYEVTYRGGLPDYPMSKEIKKYPYIIMDIMPDRFSFLPKQLSEPWFPGFELPYSKVISLDIVERTISTAESFLGSGSDNSDLRQKNVLEITYMDEGNEYVLRNEMLTGTTVMGQARVCSEMMDLLRANKILKLFAGKQEDSTITPQIDVATELKKFNDLLNIGAITQEEYDKKRKNC